jgi:hypothetical protein
LGTQGGKFRIFGGIFELIISLIEENKYSYRFISLNIAAI